MSNSRSCCSCSAISRGPGIEAWLLLGCDRALIELEVIARHPLGGEALVEAAAALSAIDRIDRLHCAHRLFHALDQISALPILEDFGDRTARERDHRSAAGER